MIRAAAAHDAGAICALWNGMIRDTLITFTTQEKTPTGIAGMIAERPGAFWVAEQSGRFAGFVTYGPFRAGPGYAATVEHTIMLVPEAKGHGLGRDLMAKAGQSAAAQGKHVMVGGISGANPQAVAFHAAVGFQEVGRMPEVGRKAGQWLDLILMQKIL